MKRQHTAIYQDKGAAHLTSKGTPIIHRRLGLMLTALFLLASCIEVDPTIPNQNAGNTGDAQLENEILLLDAASRITATDTDIALSWDGAPIPGAVLRFIVQRKRTAAAPVPRAAFSYALEQGGDGRVHEWSEPVGSLAKLAAMPKRDAYLSVLSVTIPDDMQPGPVRLHVTVGETEFDPIRLEVADPSLLAARSAAFTHAKAAWAEISGVPPGSSSRHISWSAAYAPMVRGQVLRGAAFGPQGLTVTHDKSWMFRPQDRNRDVGDGSGLLLASTNGVIWLNADGTPIEDDNSLADAPAYGGGGYNGGFWHPDGVIRGYPNNPGYPLTGGGGGYNGWFWHPDGTLRPTPPVDIDTPAGETDNDGNGNTPQPSPNPPTPTTPTGGTTERPAATPPTIPPRSTVDGGKNIFTPSDFLTVEERPTTCAKDFSESLPNFRYRDFYGQPIRSREHNGPPRNGTIYSNLPAQYADIYFSIANTSRPPQPTTALRPFAWTPNRVADAIERTIRWYAQHCVYLTFRRVDPPEFTENTRRRQAMNNYKNWLTRLRGLDIGDTITNTPGDRKVDDGISVIAGLERATRGVIHDRLRQTHRPRNRRERRRITRIANAYLTVIFMDRLVDRNARSIDAATSSQRPTESSLAITGRNTIAMHGNDADDPYVLTHELIHALGRPTDLSEGSFSWFHSPSNDAMSHLVRQSSRQQSGLWASRRWVFAEYMDASNSGQLRTSP